MCLAKEKRLPANIINANHLYQNNWELFHDSIAELEPKVLIQPKPYNHTEKKKREKYQAFRICTIKKYCIIWRVFFILIFFILCAIIHI